jgi:hypothetical protein
VETFILKDLSPDYERWSISPATYVRLAQLRIHNPDAPFFPSLKHLRIVDAKSSLFQLSFFLSNSLRSIELHNIDCTQEMVFSSFLITLANECPELSSIKLTSPVPESIWETFLKFNHLRALELKNALTQLDFSLFSTIAQAFPQLEQFILDARITEYKRAAGPDPQQWDDNVAESHPQTSQSEHDVTDAELSKLHSDGQDYPGLEPMPQYESMEPIESGGPAFLRLEKLHITGNLDLIQDLVESIPSRCLKEIRLTLVRSNRPKFPKKSGKEKRIFSGPLVRIDVETPVFATCLDKAFNTWRHTLTNLFIGQHEDYSPSDQGFPRTPVLPTLPVAACEEILLLPMVERLDISGWTIENFLQYSSPFAPIYSNLKFLHLPIQSNNKGIPFSGLRLIAELFPKLVSFQSSIVTLDDADIPVSDPSKATTHVLSHGLEILSVGNTSPNPNPKKVLDIARHIFAFIPQPQRN